MNVIGLDTSNYTTSAALYDTLTGDISQQKRLLPVKSGELGLRQSDAVFHHVRQLPEIISKLMSEEKPEISAVGVSVRPRPIEGSYMPCFEVGRSAAEQLGAVLGVPVYRFSHQEGHIAAALYSAGCLENIGPRFIAYHLSGGTTEVVLAEENDHGYAITQMGCSLDLKAGQAIDRIANMLGLPFPGGVYLEKLALECSDKISCQPFVKECNCSLSGVENKCRAFLNEGREHCYIARYCLEYIIAAIELMTEAVITRCGALPIIFAGGVASNSILRGRLHSRFGAYFAAPEFSCDNAAGIALLVAKEAAK